MSDYERIERVIRFIDAHHEEQPSLLALAKIAGVSEFHFHRLFSRWAGITPKGFLKCITSIHAKTLLKRSRSVLETALEAGLSGPGRLHDLFVSVDGVTPGEFKAKGLGMEIRYGVHLKVWEAIVRVPPGKVVSYRDVARSIGMDGSSRAVGAAVGSNKVAYLIPCHRVIRETGVFGQYRWGSLRKRAILAWEGRGYE